MLVFDTRTAFLIVGLLYLILPSFAWVVLAGQGSRPVSLWCGGGLLLGFAVILSGLTDRIPNWASLYLPTFLLLCSHLVRIQSLRLDLGIPWRMRWMLLGLMLVFLTLMFIDQGWQKHVLRAQFNSCAGAAALFYLAMLAWRIGRGEQSPSAKWISVVYALVAAVFLFRVLSLEAADNDTNLLREGLSSQLLAVSALLSCVIGHFGYVGLALDRSRRREIKTTTQRVRDEERLRLGEQIAQLDRQRSLGELSASLGHELNQPLTAILTNAQVAQRGLKTGHFDATQHLEFLDKIVHNTQRASRIVERIRGFIRPSVSRSDTVHLHQVVLEVVGLVADEARSRQVNIVLPSRICQTKVKGDPIQLSQIILNVLRNAMEALMPVTQRVIHVSCDRVGERAILRIRDTGAGFSPETLAQAGTPFFTTKPAGLGLGLSISRSIATQHGGTLIFSNASADGGGAIIELNLPALSQAQA
jgi:C4-dicarboxylate-specific signal transduction histidine kinase